MIKGPRTLSEKETVEIIARIKRYMDDGDSISLARGKGIGRPLSIGLVEQVMRHPAYVQVLNDYMKRIGKPICYVLMTTPRGLRLVALKKNKEIPQEFKDSIPAEELLPLGGVR